MYVHRCITIKLLLYANMFIYAYEIDFGTANTHTCIFAVPFNGQQQWIQGAQGVMAPLPSVKDYLSATLALNMNFFSKDFSLASLDISFFLSC